MKALSVMMAAGLATAAPSPALVWSTVLVWMVVAAVVAVVAGQTRPQAREGRGRLFWSRCMPLQPCAVCAR